MTLERNTSPFVWTFLVLCLVLGWPWFLSILFGWGDSILGVGAGGLLLLGLGALARGWRGSLLLALACILGLAQAFCDPQSEATLTWLFHSKLAQIRRGRLVYVQGWGWVDQRHRLGEVLDQLQPGPSRTIVHTYFGSWNQLYNLRIETEVRDQKQSWNALCQIGERCEDEEERLPWFLGAGLSAHDPDDLPSVYWTVFRQAYPETPFVVLGPGPNERRWRAEGRAFLRRRVHAWRDFEPADPALRPAYRQLFLTLRQNQVHLTTRLQ